MLEHLPGWLGHALRGVRAGADKIAIVRDGLAAGGATLDLTSPAFADHAALPPRFTADGEGVSPPLTWGAVPDGTMCCALLVEDADSPTPQPLVHAVVWGLPADAGRLAEGAIARDGAGEAGSGDVGHNSYRREGWLPPDPPTGHGTHHYVFQLFAIGTGATDPGKNPGRSALLDAIRGHVLGAGVLVGTHERGQLAPAVDQAIAAPVST